MHFAKTCAAAHWLWVTAPLYEQQIFIDVIAVTEASCEPVLQTSTAQWGMQFPKTSAAVHWLWATAHLYEQQIFKGVIATTQASCETVLLSSAGQCVGHFAKSQCCSALVVGHCTLV